MNLHDTIKNALAQNDGLAPTDEEVWDRQARAVLEAVIDAGWRIDGQPVDQPGDHASAVFVGHQHYSSIMSGDHGQEGWHDFKRELYTGGSSSMGGPSIWALLGRPLGENCLVRITVDVLDEGEPVRTENPWKKRRA